MADTAIAEAIPITARSLDFYNTQSAADTIPQSARPLLIEYAGIPPDKVDSHVDAIRAKAFKIFPYPCIGMYRFLDLSLRQSPVYPDIIERIKKGEHFLDLGCCFGQEVRQLIHDGAPATNLHGSDLRTEFIELGYDLFDDKEREGGKVSWHVANVFDDNEPAWTELREKISIVYTGAFFHLFDWDEQIAVAKRVVSVLKPEAGVLLLGRQMGNETAGNSTRSGRGGDKIRYRHNPQSLRKFWDEVGETTGTKWDVQAEFENHGPGIDYGKLRDKLNLAGLDPGSRRLRFIVTRV